MEQARHVAKDITKKFVKEWVGSVLVLLHEMSTKQRQDLWMIAAGVSTKPLQELKNWAVDHFEGSYIELDNGEFIPVLDLHDADEEGEIVNRMW